MNFGKNRAPHLRVQGVREFVISDKGEKVQMLGVSYPKDCMVYKIKLFVVYVPGSEKTGTSYKELGQQKTPEAYAAGVSLCL
jgi:hypothetical protein